MLKVREKRKQKHIIILGCLQHGAITFNKHNLSFKAKKYTDHSILFHPMMHQNLEALETRCTGNKMLVTL